MDSLKEEREEEEAEEGEVEEATAASEAAIDASEDPVAVASTSKTLSDSKPFRSPSLPLPPNEMRRKINLSERKLSLDASAFRPTTQQEKKRHSDFIR